MSNILPPLEADAMRNASWQLAHIGTVTRTIGRALNHNLSDLSHIELSSIGAALEWLGEEAEKRCCIIDGGLS